MPNIKGSDAKKANPDMLNKNMGSHANIRSGMSKPSVRRASGKNVK